MGQKVNPTGFRMGHFRPWKSVWFSDGPEYRDLLLEDIKIRERLMNRLDAAGIDNVEIVRLTKAMVIRLYVSRPGVVIGRGGSGIEDVKKDVLSVIKSVRGGEVPNLKIDIQVKEVKNPELSAQLVASKIAFDLGRRMPHRRVVTRAMERVMQSGAKGVKVVLSGRIGGAEIARQEEKHDGSVPSQTLRANVDFASVPVLLKRGYVGIKVWIHKKEEE